ncbi:hypothetical protein HHI36_012439 [Cryptolaemus montrouzieri]|uniref:SCP domain-containing protein n=1 Tax=Cryptolaemus montrouzieri TaxID=559131 RepID=A0ABD2NEG6_9CUCU
MKPSFAPYCLTGDICKPACTCGIYPNCMLLSMDDTIRNSILFYHNQIRDIQSKAEPQPGGMTMLQYDMELEEISSCWAARCDDENSQCFVTSRFSETSQSVTQVILQEGQQPSVFMWMTVMNDWLGQVRLFSTEIIHSLPGGKEGENLNKYAQLISDRILAVGCAWSILNNVLTLVCTYGPRGPRQGETIYKSGFPCSLCPGGYSCDYVQPFEKLCKLRIYSTVPPLEVNADLVDSPPPPPPPPNIPEVPPPPPQMADLPPPPPFPQEPQLINPIPPQLPNQLSSESMFPANYPIHVTTKSPFKKVPPILIKSGAKEERYHKLLISTIRSDIVDSPPAPPPLPPPNLPEVPPNQMRVSPLPLASPQEPQLIDPIPPQLPNQLSSESSFATNYPGNVTTECPFK